MNRLLFLVFALLAALPSAAKPPRAAFDVPYTLEHGKYVVLLETPAGPRRFIFDTGASRTVVSESLSREIGLSSERSGSVSDFEGHRQQLNYVRIPQLKLGDAAFTNLQAIVIPDSSYIFRCFGFDGILGCDLLREFVVRMPNPDSTITFAGNLRQLGELDRRYAVRMHFAGNCPMVVPRLSNGKNWYKVWMKFDTGSADYLDCRYDECLSMIDNGVASDVRRTDGHSGNLGWTNRSVMNEAVKGVIPRFDLAANSLEGVPFSVTHGSSSKLGCGIFRWGTVVMDFPGRRFWLLPHAEKPDVPDTSVKNVTVGIDGGRLVVGQVWDEALRDQVAPGDRIVKLGTISVEQVDPCAILRGEVSGDKPEMTVRRADGTLVTVPIKKL